MRLDGDHSQVPPNHLRRRHRVQRAPPQFSSDLSTDQDMRLELSMHIPAEPCGNRYEVLGRTYSSPRRNEVDRTSTYRRRSCCGRGSKEGRRRRDGRRNRRRLAAVQMLDEQLSRDIDRTLRQANVQEPMPLRFPPSTLLPPVTRIADPESIGATKTSSPTPYLNLGPLGNNSYSNPHRSTYLSPQLPSWCPSMPGFLSGITKWNECPLFFDLSRLPDPIEHPRSSPQCQEMQLWRPTINFLPQKQSPFIVPATYPQKGAKVASTACKLHNIERSNGNANVNTSISVPCTLEASGQVADDIGNDGRDEQSDASAANLWNILNTPRRVNRNDHHDPYIDSFSCESAKNEDTGRHLPYKSTFEALCAPCELENTELPFVHGNSLTGHANERATLPLSGSEGGGVSFDAPMSITPVTEPLYGLNELVGNQYRGDEYADVVLCATDLPPLPPSPCQEPTAPMSTMPVQVTHENTDSEKGLAEYDAHHKSEQALFEPRSPVIKPRDDDIVDATTFVQIGHTPDCWCNDCNDPPELVIAEDVSDDEEWMDFLALSRSPSPPLPTAWEAEWGVFVEDVEGEDETWAEGWEDFLSCTPSSLAHGPW